MATECSIDECHKPASCRGWCRMHYNRWYRHGDPLALHTVTPAGKPYLHRVDGYMAVREPDHPLAVSGGRVMIHRKMAWDAGMFTDPRMHVHHINEDKLDNRLENFEILTPSEHARLHNPPRPKS